MRLLRHFFLGFRRTRDDRLAYGQIECDPRLIELADQCR
jgi:hypothetical protein